MLYEIKRPKAHDGARNHRKKQIKYTNIGKTYIRDSVVEAPRDAAEPPQAQSIRSRRFGSLQRVKSRAQQRMVQIIFTTKNKSNINIVLVLITSEIQLLKRREVRQSPRKRRASGGADLVP
jgi:hypothetical protein